MTVATVTSAAVDDVRCGGVALQRGDSGVVEGESGVAHHVGDRRGGVDVGAGLHRAGPRVDGFELVCVERCVGREDDLDRREVARPGDLFEHGETGAGVGVGDGCGVVVLAEVESCEWQRQDDQDECCRPAACSRALHDAGRPAGPERGVEPGCGCGWVAIASTQDGPAEHAEERWQHGQRGEQHHGGGDHRTEREVVEDGAVDEEQPGDRHDDGPCRERHGAPRRRERDRSCVLGAAPGEVCFAVAGDDEHREVDPDAESDQGGCVLGEPDEVGPDREHAEHAEGDGNAGDR